MDSSEATRDSASRRAEIRAATRTVAELVASLWQVQGGELGALLGEFDALAAVACGARVAVVGEAESRGEIAASQAGSTAGWVAEHAPTLAAGSGAGQVARLVRECARPDMTIVQAAAVSGQVSVSTALTVVSEFARLKPRLREEAAPTVLQGLLDMGIADGPKGVRSLRPALLAAHGADGEFQADADTAERLVSLSRPSTDELGALTYQLILDPVGAAALEAAIGPLSAPVPGPDSERDPRSPQLRRGQALIEVCRRATSAGDRPPSGVKTTLMLTMSYDDLAARTGAATVIGSAQGGSLIAPETVRRLACDATIIPTVLGGRGEILDQGRSTRLATPGQLAALWLRDAGCSFPGCTTPAHWCDAHHLVHWADGGTSDLTNLALLCGRHHSVVHRDHLIGHVTDASAATGAVTWNVIPGSYDRRHHAIPPPGDPPPGGQPPGDPPDTVALTQSSSDADPWGDLWAGSRDPDEPPSTDHSARDRDHTNPEADPWYRAEHPHDQRPPDDPVPDRDTAPPEADPWADSREPDEPPATDHSARDQDHANPEADPWGDLWDDTPRRASESTEHPPRHDANPEADPWFDSGVA
ncbi:MAG: DUF222 domain-containing protein [Actinomycetales bacterium]|uniref:DUF222 domain-containing protein n=1 Tax=Candidatus Phosphoribacter hodrii TaxID=2953743 RepID=A0A935IMQ9_9MICO|nr:DUF222 domain-containing protein [Candidatus Phosphoribacter hodrii]